MSDIIPFDFEEQAVRVLMRDGEPWFVAADVCRVLEHSNTSVAVSRLDDDERDVVNLNTLNFNEGIRGNPNASIISQSGLFALILTSNKPAARRFRKWITAEVLPAIRRTGRYELPEAVEPAPAPQRFGEDLNTRDWLALIRETRILHGVNAGRRMWALSPLPNVAPRALAAPDPAEGWACIDFLLAAEIEGEALAAWLRRGEDDAALAHAGLRLLPGGLFVGNAAPVFAPSRWAGGLHRAALLSLAGVLRDESARTLAGAATRGLIVPLALLLDALSEGVDHA